MARLASAALLSRGAKRVLPRMTAMAACTSSSSVSLAPTAQLFGAHQRLEDTYSISAIGALALALGAALHETRCEALETKDAAAPRATYFDEDYEPCQLVGSGSCGMVLQCVHKRDGHLAAVKMIQDNGINIREEVARETEALALVKSAGGHQNIVRYDGQYAHDGFHYIVTEFVHGESLYAHIQSHRQLDVQTALRLTTQLASALAFLRKQNLIHRDLKPANIMVSSSTTEEDLQLKIIDFGSAEKYTKSKPARAMALSGTRCYWPPEVLERQETLPAMDMWALGCILYIMVAGRHPFDMMGSSSEDEIVHRVLTTDKVSFLHPVWSSVPSSVKSLIRGLLEKDPSARLSVEEVLAHPALHATS